MIDISWLSDKQKRCLLAFDSFGRILPTQSIAYKLRDEDRHYTAVKRTAYNVMNNFRARGFAEATVFMGQCRWSLTEKGNALRLEIMNTAEGATQ